MRTRDLLTSTAGLLLLLAANACGPASDSAIPHLVPPGKADNYYSNRAAEFKVRGSIPVKMTAEEYADDVAREDKITRRLTAVGLYLTAYVSDKFRGIDINDDGEITDDEVFFHNEGYGEFYAMVRNYTVVAQNVSGDPESGISVEFTLDMAGPPNLLGLIPKAEDAQPEEGFVFTLQMPEGETIDPTNVPRKKVIRNFDPEKHEGELETIRCSAVRQPDAGNAYPQFSAFFADGVYDITLFYGHDYNKSRSDLREAEEAYDTLEYHGFKSPVDKFEDLKADSGPFVRDAKADGKPIKIEVRVFHSDMFKTARKAQHDLALSEIAARDVFFYNGHAGPYYGFYLDKEGAAKVDYHEFAEAGFSDKQQLVVAQGCQTYSQYADSLYAHEKKSEANLDVITTVNYSYGSGTMDLLANLIKLDGEGNHMPVDFHEIITSVNGVWPNGWNDVFYGVMGIEGNPQLHPYADLSTLGKSCSESSECGDRHGNVCVVVDDEGSRQCAPIALSADACPVGTTLRDYADAFTIDGSVCFPTQP